MAKVKTRQLESAKIQINWHVLQKMIFVSTHALASLYSYPPVPSLWVSTPPVR